MSTSFTTPFSHGCLALAILASCLPAAAGAAPAGAPAGRTYQIIGYYPGWRSGVFPANSSNIDANQLTVVNYAFLNLCWHGKQGNPDASVDDVRPCAHNPPDGAIVLGDEAIDPTNLKALVALKSVNPKLKLMASVGGWSWSNQFSNMAASAATRSNFVDSAVALVRQYKLDGVDIDWEYPTSVGVPCTPGNTCQRPRDKQNFLTLAQALRTAFDSAGSVDGKAYLITIAAGAGRDYVFDPDGSSAWITGMAATLDWINIMTYDFHGPWDSSSNNVAPLYRDPADTSPHAAAFNTSAAVKLYLHQGIAASKLVLGEPFYGYGWAGCDAGPHGDGLYQPCTGPASGSDGATFDFAYLTGKGYLTKDSSGKYTVGGKGFVRRWNSESKVPYLYNPSTQVFITYEDEASIHEKDAFIRAQGLRGGMFWELYADRRKTLGSVLAKDLPH